MHLSFLTAEDPEMKRGLLFLVAQLAFNIVLLGMAGLLTFNRRRAGKTLHIIWASVAMIFLIGGVSVRFWVTYKGHVDIDAAFLASTAGRMAYPIFLLIWLNRRRMRDEIKGWRRDTPEYLQPDQAAAKQAQQVTVWPVVIGWLSIISGCKGLLHFPEAASGLLNIISVGLDGRYLVSSIVSCLDSCPVAVLAILAGVLLIRRRRLGRTLMIVWVLLKLILMAQGNWHLWRTAVELDWSTAIVKWNLATGMLNGAIYPIFLLIWFSRKKIRDEVQSWGKDKTQDVGATTLSCPPKPESSEA